LNQDDAKFCAECQVAMDTPTAPAKGKPLSDAALRAAEARARYESSAPSSADLSELQWYLVCRFFPEVARRASAVSHRPLADVGEHNPLHAVRPGPLFGTIRRRTRNREPGEDDA
jgi:hypothetical protein